MSNDQIEIADKLASVRAACEKAPDGPKRRAAFECYRAAEKAHIARNAAHTVMELDAATAALS